jgi:outer membrane protein TolC
MPVAAGRTAVVAAVSAVVLGFAPAVAGDTLTLEDAVRLGLEHAPELAAGRAGKSAAEADRDAASGARWPRLLAEASWHRSDNQVQVFSDKLTAADFTPADFAIDTLNHPDAIDHGLAALGIEFPLYTSGRLSNGIEAAREDALAAAARVRGSETDTVAAVTEAYYAVAFEEARVATAQAALDNAAAHESVAEARFENGAALKSDWLRTRSFRLGRARGLESERAALETASWRLRVLLGLSAEHSPALAIADLPEPPSDPGDLQGWLKDAQATRPDLEASRHERLAAEAAARVAGAARGPDIGGTVRYEEHANDLSSADGSYFAGIGIRWTAFDRARGARVAAARARAEASAALDRGAGVRAAVEVEGAWRATGVALRNLASARQEAEDAAEARRIVAERYASGAGPLTDVLDSESNLLEARLAEIAARYDALVGRVRLERAANRLEVPR